MLHRPVVVATESERSSNQSTLTLLILCHYDTDKSYWGRKWAYPKLWGSLKSGGVFISDDIQDNFAFKEFVEEKGVIFSVIESQGKYVGIFTKK